MTDPETARMEKHLLGFALFGWAWPVFALFWRLLGWIVELVLIVILAIVETFRWTAGRLRMR